MARIRHYQGVILRENTWERRSIVNVFKNAL